MKRSQRKGTSPAIPTKTVRPNVRHSPALSQASVLAKKSNPSSLKKCKSTNPTLQNITLAKR